MTTFEVYTLTRLSTLHIMATVAMFVCSVWLLISVVEELKHTKKALLSLCIAALIYLITPGVHATALMVVTPFMHSGSTYNTIPEYVRDFLEENALSYVR